MATLQNFFSVGTTPVQVLTLDRNRLGWRITMFSTGIEAGNTGRVHVGRGFVPGNVLGQPNTGDVLVQGSELSEVKAYEKDVIHLAEIWLIASAADQRVSVEETVPS